MANTNVKTRLVGMVQDTSVQNITIVGETRVPTGCIIRCSYADLESLGDVNGVVPIFEASYSLGVTDFTDVACVSNTTEDEQQPSDNHQAHDDASGDIIRLLQPGSSTVLDRSASVAAIAGGIALTPGEAGDNFILQVTLIFGAECKAFSFGGAINNAVETDVAHGLSGKPECGWISGATVFQGTSDSRAQVAWGLFSDDGGIKQHAISQRSSDASTSKVHGESATDRVFISVFDTGNVLYGMEMTGNDATNSSFTLRGNNAASVALIGLLTHMGDVTADLQILNLPINPSLNWIVNSVGFVPQYMCSIVTQAVNADGPINQFDASTMGMAELDDAAVDSTIQYSVRHNIQPTETYSLASNGFVVSSGSQGLRSAMYNPFLTSNGFQVSALDIQLLDSTSRILPTLFIEQAASTSPDATLSSPAAAAVGVSQAQGTVVTDTINGTIYGVVTQSITTPSHAQIIAGLDDLGAAADSSDSVSVVVSPATLDFFGLSTGNTYFAHYTQISSGGTPSNNQVTSASFQTSDINLSPVIESAIPSQVVTIGVAFNLDISSHFSDPDGDPLTFTGENMPSGLSMSSPGVISGVPTGGGSAPTEISSITFDFPSLLNIAPGNSVSALESDNWPICWLADNDQMTSFGDGMGFGNLSGNENTRGSFGFSRIENNEGNFSCFDIFKSGEAMPTSEQGKCYGMIGANGKVYASVDYYLVGGSGSREDRYHGNSLISNTIAGANAGNDWTEEIRWDSGDWGGNQLNGFYSMAFIQYQSDNSGLRSPLTSDTYVYAIIMEHDDDLYNVQDPGGISLMRVLEADIESGVKADWEYLSNIDINNNPSWSTVITDRISHFLGQGGNDSSSIHYNEPLGRYVLTVFHNDRATGPSNSDCFIGFYDAPEPWGPWHTILRTNVQTLGLADGNAVIYWDHSNKWLSNDGLTGWLVGTLLGQDEFGVIKYTLTVG